MQVVDLIWVCNIEYFFLFDCHDFYKKNVDTILQKKCYKFDDHCFYYKSNGF